MDIAIRRAITINTVSQQADILLTEGIIPAMTTVKDPQCLDDLFALTTACLDQFRTTTHVDKSKVDRIITSIVDKLYKCPRTVQYGQNIRKQYL